MKVRFDGRDVGGLVADILQCIAGDVELGFSENERRLVYANQHIEYGDEQFLRIKRTLANKAKSLSLQTAVSFNFEKQ